MSRPQAVERHRDQPSASLDGGGEQVVPALLAKLIDHGGTAELLDEQRHVDRAHVGAEDAGLVCSPYQVLEQLVAAAGLDAHLRWRLPMPTPARAAKEAMAEALRTPLKDVLTTNERMFEWLAERGYQADLATLRDQFPGLPAFQDWLGAQVLSALTTYVRRL